jgi:hypothetical protein
MGSCGDNYYYFIICSTNEAKNRIVKGKEHGIRVQNSRAYRPEMGIAGKV